MSETEIRIALFITSLIAGWLLAMLLERRKK